MGNFGGLYAELKKLKEVAEKKVKKLSEKFQPPSEKPRLTDAQLRVVTPGIEHTDEDYQTLMDMGSAILDETPEEIAKREQEEADEVMSWALDDDEFSDTESDDGDDVDLFEDLEEDEDQPEITEQSSSSDVAIDGLRDENALLKEKLSSIEETLAVLMAKREKLSSGKQSKQSRRKKEEIEEDFGDFQDIFKEAEELNDDYNGDYDDDDDSEYEEDDDEAFEFPKDIEKIIENWDEDKIIELEKRLKVLDEDHELRSSAKILKLMIEEDLENVCKIDE